ncbi:unnamed protein product [Lymnaea stagnalis]|uniref:Caspase recruitment domain-containing protein n=1 Tax=Lymnaea stagnalis TaxID=6523 RepID=A0AAV2HXS4_LYMST
MSRASVGNDRHLENLIRHYFEKMVIPGNVLAVFHKYDHNVLTDRDISKVRAQATNHGDHEGAACLLNCLVVYKDWFPCLLNVLRDSDVKLSHVADLFEEATLEPDTASLATESVSSSPPSEFAPPPPNSPKDLQNDFTLESKKTSTANVDRSPPRTPFGKSMATDDCADHCVQATNEDYETPRQLNPLQSVTIIRGARKALSQAKVTSNKPERNFTKDEATLAMRLLPGFHPRIIEKDIFTKLRPLKDKDGHYILWYWEDKKRPALCVTHEGEIKTLLVHKKPDPVDKTRVSFYYINKNEHQDKDLTKLIETNIERGVMDVTQTPKNVKIRFLNPVKP